MPSFVSLILIQFGESVTRHARSLGDADAETGWPAITYTESAITMFIEGMTNRIVDTDGGLVEEERLQGYTVTPLNQFDRIERNDILYEVEFKPEEFLDKGTVMYYRAVLLRVT